MAQNTVKDAMVLCGLDDDDSETIASEIFLDDFQSVMDISETELTDSFKTLSGLTQAQGQLRVLPAQKNKIKAFIQWVRDMIRTGIDPASRTFPVDEAAGLLRRAKTHKLYMDKSDTISSAAKPEKFSQDLNWEDWAPSFANYLRAIPGRNGVPLKYVIRKEEEPDSTPHPDFIDDYVAMAPLNGPAFTSDAAEVHTFLLNFIAGNTEAESIVKVHQERNGRDEWLALQVHYEGEGIYAHDITKAENDLATLYYSGERKPHMW